MSFFDDETYRKISKQLWVFFNIWAIFVITVEDAVFLGFAKPTVPDWYCVLQFTTALQLLIFNIGDGIWRSK